MNSDWNFLKITKNYRFRFEKNSEIQAKKISKNFFFSSFKKSRKNSKNSKNQLNLSKKKPFENSYFFKKSKKIAKFHKNPGPGPGDP